MLRIRVTAAPRRMGGVTPALTPGGVMVATGGMSA